VGRLQGAVHRDGHPGRDAGAGHQPQPKLLVAWPVLLFVGITFSCIALIFNALAKGYDFFTYYFTLFLTPMMFLSGVFFPRTSCPRWCAPSPTGCR
jgi:ABC-type multidrug transport system permease subunit